jgi:hypothetical protein
MTAFKCNRHGLVIGKTGYACKHISKNIDNGTDSRCFRVALLPSEEELLKGKLHEGTIAFCASCFEDKGLASSITIAGDAWEEFFDIMDKYEIVFVCPGCLDDYVKMNQLN